MIFFFQIFYSTVHPILLHFWLLPTLAYINSRTIGYKTSSQKLCKGECCVIANLARTGSIFLLFIQRCWFSYHSVGSENIATQGQSQDLANSKHILKTRIGIFNANLDPTWFTVDPWRSHLDHFGNLWIN